MELATCDHRNLSPYLQSCLLRRFLNQNRQNASRASVCSLVILKHNSLFSVIFSPNVGTCLWETKTIAPYNLFWGNVPHSFVKETKASKTLSRYFFIFTNNAGLLQVMRCEILHEISGNLLWNIFICSDVLMWYYLGLFFLQNLCEYSLHFLKSRILFVYDSENGMSVCRSR